MSELQFLSQVIDAKADRIKSLAREIWGYAELAYEEEKSAAANRWRPSWANTMRWRS